MNGELKQHVFLIGRNSPFHAFEIILKVLIYLCMKEKKVVGARLSRDNCKKVLIRNTKYSIKVLFP